MYFKKILRLIILLASYTPTFYHLNIYASDNSSEGIKEPLLKKRKLTETSDGHEEIICPLDLLGSKPHGVDSSPRALSALQTTELTSSSDKNINISESSRVNDSFHIFNVGQGNAQLAIYTEGEGEPFAMLYDCGSSAETVNSKILNAQSYNRGSKPFLMRRVETSPISKPLIPNAVNLPLVTLDEAKVLPIHMTESESLESSEDSFSNEAEKENPKTPIAMNLKSTLEKANNLFVILSHPDKDHINLLRSSLPTTTNVLLILCGNFFIKNDNAHLKKDVKELFSFIADRIRSYPTKTFFTLPYFWPSEHIALDSSLNYSDIKNFLSIYPSSHIFPSGIDTHLPKGFQGDFATFLQKMHQIDSQENIANTSQPPFYRNFSEDPRLKDIYIWHINQISDDINNHSPVISFRMPNLEKTFICTGDAGPEVFQKIHKKISTRISEQPVKNSSSETNMSEEESSPIRLAVNTHLHLHGAELYIVILMLPHHGSGKNLSYSMLDLFAPHILGISAGAGSMYRHPSTELIKLYKKTYKDKEHLGDRKIQLWERYRTNVAHHFLTFRDEIRTEKGRNPVTRARLNRLEKNKLPIISTGIAGTIDVTKKGFYSQFTNNFQYKDQSYAMELSQAIFINDLESPKVTGESIEITKKNQKLHLSPNIKEIRYDRTVFRKNQQDNQLERVEFISEDDTQLLVALDIKYKKDGKVTTIQKFYLADIVATTDNLL